LSRLRDEDRTPVTVEGPAHEPEPISPYQRILTKTLKEHRLFSVHWELTYRCNQRCSHCYLDVLSPNARVSDELTTAECLRIVDDLAAAGALNLALSGGEPFLRRDLFHIAAYARSKGFLLRIFSNGLLITPALADRMAALHPYAVEVSLYGADAQTHDAITSRPGSFGRTVRALRLLRERGRSDAPPRVHAANQNVTG
jgi:MoaA/NifB/PqqE/SkfB family radical SAM enzyme